MFSDNKTKDLAKTALKIMTRDIQEEEETVSQELSESTQTDEAVQELAVLIDSLLIEGIAEYIGSVEESLNVEFDDKQINEMSTKIMEEINNLDDEAKVHLGESLLNAHNNSLTED
tara:strand:- start:13257 stop:13604 length:348 start_codon:yes stop_codon:yes gene_type:complete